MDLSNNIRSLLNEFIKKDDWSCCLGLLQLILDRLKHRQIRTGLIDSGRNRDGHDQ